MIATVNAPIARAAGPSTVVKPAPDADNPSVANFAASSVAFFSASFCINFPIPSDALPIPSVSVVVVFTTGPKAAATPRRERIVFCCSGSSCPNRSANPATFFIKSASGGNNSRPMVIAASCMVFLAIRIWDSEVWYLCSASFVRALFSSHALLARRTDSAKTSPAPADRSRASRIRTSVIPMSVRISIASSPRLFAVERFFINAWSAPTASFSKASLN